MIFQSLIDRDKLLYGIGPGEALKSGIVENRYFKNLNNFGVNDGVTGFTWILFQSGLYAALFFLLLIFRVFFMTLIKSFRVMKYPSFYLYSMGLLGVTLTFMFDFVVYSESFLRAEFMYILWFYLVYLVHYDGRKFLAR